MPEPLIEIRDVTVYRGDTRVFENFSLTLRAGENTAILGPNGAGKTTLLKLLTRELYPVHRPGSSVKILGRERWAVSDLRGLLGLVSNDLHQDYTSRVIGEDVVLSGYYSSIGVWRHQHYDAAQVAASRRVMEQLEIIELSGKPFAQMSTGQQRRFLLGRALIHRPRYLVLDEPTSGLDVHASHHYMRTIRALMREGRTVVLVTHHINEIPPEVERIVLLDDGRVVADGPKSELLTDETLSALYDTPVHVVRARGYYQVVPSD